MCAGKGRRLLPLTADRPKAMVEINGKPIIYWILNELKKTSINKIYLIVGYREGIIKNYIKYNFSDMNIEFVHQTEQTGTADAIYLIKDKIEEDEFIVLSGDIIYLSKEIEKLMGLKNSLLYTQQKERLYEYGTLDVDCFDEDGNIKIKFLNEKSSRPSSDYVNCGAYHFNRDIFDYIDMTFYDTRFNEKIITNAINYMIDNGVEFYGIPIKELNEVSYPKDIEKIERRLKL